MSRHPWSRLGEPNAGRQPWASVWLPNTSDDKWTIHTERSETMQTPSKTDLETLAIRLGCPAAAIDGGVVFRYEGLEQAWYLVVGSRPLVATQGFGRVHAAWCMALPGTKEGPVAAFWSLWDSVGDLDPETLQARREAAVAVKRDAAAESGWTRAGTLQEWFALHPVGSTVGYGIAGEGIGLGAHLRPAPPRHLDVSVRPCFWMVMDQPERGS